METFTLRTYGKSELAMLYCPNCTADAATRTLNRWILRCTALSAELRALGYNPRRHTFFRPEVEAIVRHLGEP